MNGPERSQPGRPTMTSGSPGRRPGAAGPDSRPEGASRYEERFARRATGIVSSAMRDLMSLSERPEIISLAGGFPDTDCFPRDIFENVISAISSDHLASSLQYGPTEGLLGLREQILEVMVSEGATARVEDTMLTTGGQQGIDLTVRSFIDPGDVVIAEGPTYPGAVPSLTTFEADVRHISLDDEGMSIDHLEQELERLDAEGRAPKLIYTIPNFHNPAGVTMSLRRREQLIEIAHRREILILEDNPYGQIRFEGAPLPTLWELDGGAGWVIYISTFSKILAPGIRLGWMAAPQPVLRKVNLGKQAADLCSSTFNQRFVMEYLRRYDWQDHVARVIRIYRDRRDAMLAALEREMPSEAGWTRPGGGLFVWATLPDYLSAEDLLAEASSRHQVAFVPGRAAFLDGQGANSLRLNFSGVPEPMIEEGIRRLGGAVADMSDRYRAFRGGAP